MADEPIVLIPEPIVTSTNVTNKPPEKPKPDVPDA